MPIFLSVFTGVIALLIALIAGMFTVPAESVYQKRALDAARSEYHRTGSIPATVKVLGSTISTTGMNVAPDEKIVDYQRLKIKKDKIEQIVLNACVSLQGRCQTQAVDKLWAFMPNAEGLISTDILGGTTSTSIDCATATTAEFATYGRYLVQGAMSASDVTAESFNGVNYNFFYSKPGGVGATGCGFEDIVDMR